MPLPVSSKSRLLTIPAEIRQRICTWVFSNALVFIKPYECYSTAIPELPRSLSLLLVCRQIYGECEEDFIKHVIVRTSKDPETGVTYLDCSNYFGVIRSKAILKQVTHIAMDIEDIYMLLNDHISYGSLRYKLPKFQQLTIWHPFPLSDAVMDLAIELIKPVKSEEYDHKKAVGAAEEVPGHHMQHLALTSTWLRRHIDIIEDGSLAVVMEFCLRTSRYLDQVRIARAKFLPSGQMDVKMITEQEAITGSKWYNKGNSGM